MSIHQIRKREKTVDVFVILNQSTDYSLVQALLDYMMGKGIAFTGCKYYASVNRVLLKKICRQHDIPTSPYIFADDYEDLKKYPEVGQFPLFVKPNDGTDSMFVSEKSIVRNEQELKERVEYVWNNFGGALVERFIDGQQFTVLVAGNRENCLTFPALQHVFSENQTIQSFEDKYGTGYHPSWKKI